MSREDWDVYKQTALERKEKRAKRRAAFNGGPGWKKCHETHWQYTLRGDILDYWPGTMRFRWRGKTMTGDVMAFIKKREDT
jgi:hypothetical protein